MRQVDWKAQEVSGVSLQGIQQPRKGLSPSSEGVVHLAMCSAVCMLPNGLRFPPLHSWTGVTKGL